jgi:predicted transcriptional regulator of viral defense system
VRKARLIWNHNARLIPRKKLDFFLKTIQIIYRINNRKCAIETIKSTYGGQIHMFDAVKAGITRTVLYGLYKNRILEKISRGVYRLQELPSISNPDIAIIALRAPKAVLCLISALSFHAITTQIPHKIYIALPRKTISPRLDDLPLSIHRFSDQAYSEGREEHEIDGIKVTVYSVEKTIADCFKFRNSIGMDVVLEALKLYRSRKQLNVPDLLKYARICRIERVMTPYLEVSL